jgi:FdhD protein
MLFENEMERLQIQGTIKYRIIKVNGQQATHAEDLLAIEEPLQIELQVHTVTGRINKNIAVTMRTPGHDEELAAGFLFSEGIIKNHSQIQNITHAGKPCTGYFK